MKGIYTALDGNEYEVKIITRLDFEKLDDGDGERFRYLIELPFDDHGHLTTINESGIQIWDGNLFVIGASNLRVESEEE